jgi:hypothetical protein
MQLIVVLKNSINIYEKTLAANPFSIKLYWRL